MLNITLVLIYKLYSLDVFVSFIDQLLLICLQRLHVIICTARLLLTVILLTVIPIQQS